MEESCIVLKIMDILNIINIQCIRKNTANFIKKT